MLKIIFIYLFFSSLLFSQEALLIKQSKVPYSLGKQTSYFVDKSNNVTLLEVQEKTFTPSTKKILNFGFLQPTYWFKFQFTFDTAVDGSQWWLDINYPLLNYVDLYAFDEENRLLFHKKNGNLVAQSHKDMKANRILFSLPNKCHKSYTVYLKVKTSGSMLVPLSITSTKRLFKEIYLDQTLSGLYYGILLILILYSSITFIYTREKLYLLYISFIISYGLWQLSYDGLGAYYIWTDNHWMIEKGIAFLIYSSTLALIIFSQALLQSQILIANYNKIILQSLKYLAIIGVVSSILFPYQYTIIGGAVLGILTPIALFIGGILVLKQGYYNIRFFVIGWGFFLIATVLFALSKFNIVHGFIIMKYGQQIGSIVDLVFLAIALAYRFIQLQDDYTKTLENQVQEAVMKERAKDRLLIEQSKLASMGEMMEQIAHQWRQPLNNIGLINQEIYFKQKLSTLSDEDFEKCHEQIDTNIEYLSDTINNFRMYYQRNQEKETYALDDALTTVIHITEATFKFYQINIVVEQDKDARVHTIKSDIFQVFLNILNNAKDAFLENKIDNKTIRITVSSDSQNAYVHIADNAGGIPSSFIDNIFDSYFSTKSKEIGTGIGLYMAKTIIEENMQGKLTVSNKDEGACFVVQLPLDFSDEKPQSLQ